MKKKLNKVIVFDAYGTLLDLNSIDKILLKNFGGKGTLIGKLWRLKQLEYSWLRSLMNRYEPFDKITTDALLFATAFYNIRLEESVKNKILNNYHQLSFYTEVPGILRTLHGRYKLSVLSNANLKMLKAAIDYNGCLSKFDYILSADAVQDFKPKPSIYQLAIDTIGVKKEEITFVSSNAWDVSGAKSFGFHVVWVNRGGAVFDQTGQIPNEVVSSLVDLLNL